jgi:DNA helicase INO80
MDDEELAESVAKRKQAEAHGYVAPTINPVASSKGLGDTLNLGGGDEDEDDFFSLKRKVPNGEDEDEAVPAPAPAAGTGEGGKKTKRKAEGEREFIFSLCPVILARGEG